MKAPVHTVNKGACVFSYAPTSFREPAAEGQSGQARPVASNFRALFARAASAKPRHYQSALPARLVRAASACLGSEIASRLSCVATL
ncbi:hypothetical protein SKAU_G00187110 [Synaphobranchus kaupii]|uniref:Uncharacterized protein n=1 Tax=Synaphobranchus kaupii TaxID=118154 RepID=A0A9Q1FCW0_SYNKA|nr:hypothetical protein SKAU_G00187110 [Synaphobranchus kaupii]